MAPQKTPVFWVWVDEWPLTGSGKIRKFQLREMFERGEYDDQTIDRAPVAGHDQPT